MQQNPGLRPSPQNELDLKPIGLKFLIRKSAVETDGRSFEMEMELLPHSGGTPLHIHPNAIEEYEVLQGTFEVNIAGVWKTANVGDRVIVEKGVAHTFRNTGDDAVTVYNIHRPALKFESYFRRLFMLANSGVFKSQKMTPKAILHLSMLITSYPDEIRSVKPPQAIMRLLASLGRLIGYRSDVEVLATNME
jgi:mannose-6-phosphate isomerase-like protein (cupin superfamily)